MKKILETPLRIKSGNVPIRSGSWDRYILADGIIYVFDDGRICWSNERRLFVRDQRLLRKLFRVCENNAPCFVCAYGGLMNEVPVASRKMVVSTICAMTGAKP